MANTLPNPTDCCASCDDPVVENVPGPAGAAGDDGADGSNGSNAFTDTTADFTMPAYGASVSVQVGSSAWISAGQTVYVDFAGYMLATAAPDGTHVTLQNISDGSTSYPDNSAPGTTIPTSSLVSPAGIQGPDGSLTGDAGGDLSGTYPNPKVAITTTKGDIIVNSGSANVRLAVGTDGMFLKADSTAANGVKYDKVDLSASSNVKNSLAIANGGTGATTAAAARTALGLGSVATQASSNVSITGGSITGITDLAVADGGTGSSTASGARANLNVLAGYGILGSSDAIDCNSGGSDNAITMLSGRYRIDKVMVDNGSVNMTTATSGLFTAAGGGGTTIAADQALSDLTASTKFKDLALQAVAGTDVFTAGTLYFRVGTAQGAAATLNVKILGWKLD